MARRCGPVLGVLLIAPLVLTGCAHNADWDGTKRLSSEQCRLAAQLFATAEQTGAAPAGSSGGPGSAPHTTAPHTAAPLTTAELADALRPYTGEQMGQVLEYYSSAPDPESRPTSPEEQEAAAAHSKRFNWAEGTLQGWAVLACGQGIATGQGTAQPGPTALPALSEMQLSEVNANGTTLLTVLGALEPDHAVTLCEEVRSSHPKARIAVKDADGFPLASAEPGAECDYDPALFEGLNEAAQRAAD